MASTSTGICSQCSEATTKRCARCFGGLKVDGTIQPTTYYCGQKCQREHLHKHRPVCTAASHRRQLYRAGELVQALYYEYRRAVFDVPIEAARQGTDGKLRIYEAESETTDILFDFPDHLFSTEDDKKAMLAWRACDDGLVRLRAIIAQCFEGRSVHSYGRRLGTKLDGA